MFYVAEGMMLGAIRLYLFTNLCLYSNTNDCQVRFITTYKLFYTPRMVFTRLAVNIFELDTFHKNVLQSQELFVIFKLSCTCEGVQIV